jgi:hypothetical protein
MRSLIPFAFTLVIVLPACVSTPEPKVAPQGQTFAAAVALMCDVDRQAGLPPEANPLTIGLQRTAWITEHADNPDAIELRVLLSVKDPGEQAHMLRAQAKELCLPGCALADTLEHSGEGGLAP